MEWLQVITIIGTIYFGGVSMVVWLNKNHREDINKMDQRHREDMAKMDARWESFRKEDNERWGSFRKEDNERWESFRKEDNERWLWLFERTDRKLDDLRKHGKQ